MTARAAAAARDNEFARAERAAKFILSKSKLRPQIALVLGSGLGAFADELAGATKIPYQKIPGFPRSTAVGHAGQLVIGKVGSIEVAVMQGRVHFYEGYTAKEVVFPMRVLGRLGIRSAILTNAAGGIDLGYKQGALVVIRDHINLQGANPLIGPNDERFGPRFPDMKRPLKFAISGQSEPIWSACPRCRKRSLQDIWAFAYWEFLALRIWPRAFSINRSTTQR
jgi:purine-nucleoside phosphorylase